MRNEKGRFIKGADPHNKGIRNKLCTKCGVKKTLDNTHWVDGKEYSGFRHICKNCWYAQCKKYNSTEEGKISQNKKNKNRRQKYPERQKAIDAVHNALKSKKLVKQPCDICRDTKVHGHHEDYSKPLQVIWLCSIHHRQRHEVLKCCEAGYFCGKSQCPICSQKAL